MTTHYQLAAAHRLRVIAALATLALMASMVRADVQLPQLFNDHMVLQRDIPISVWGHADAGEEVTVRFGGRVAMTRANGDGSWRVNLKKFSANAASQTLIVKGKNTVVFNDVLVGDVWVCSGQSNMALYLGETHNAAQDVAAANDSLLRLFRVSERTSIKPEADVELWNGKKWLVCTSEDANSFTAVGYFFGHELRKHLNIPIGLIDSSYGGSKAQLWTSVDSIERNVTADPEFKSWLDRRKAVVQDYPRRLAQYLPEKVKYDQESTRYGNEVENDPQYVAKKKAWEQEKAQAVRDGKAEPPFPQPSQAPPQAPNPPDKGPYTPFMVGNLYNAMIAPLTPFAIKGVIWYQGESNSDNDKQYRALFPILIGDWRQKWRQGNFPFIFVQLPNIGNPATEPVQDKDLWPGLREAQAKALSLPNTGMATTIDVGDPYNVHGKDKFDVGLRLSLVARHLVYKEDIVFSGPTYDSMKVEGSKISISFKNTGTGLVIGTAPWNPSGTRLPVAAELKGFAIAGPDKKWVWANAQIKGSRVIVFSAQVLNPVAVRYGWAENPPCNLYNKEKLPAAPFRTDDWGP